MQFLAPVAALMAAYSLVELVSAGGRAFLVALASCSLQLLNAFAAAAGRVLDALKIGLAGAGGTVVVLLDAPGLAVLVELARKILMRALAALGAALFGVSPVYWYIVIQVVFLKWLYDSGRASGSAKSTSSYEPAIPEALAEQLGRASVPSTSVRLAGSPLLSNAGRANAAPDHDPPVDCEHEMASRSSLATELGHAPSEGYPDLSDDNSDGDLSTSSADVTLVGDSSMVIPELKDHVASATIKLSSVTVFNAIMLSHYDLCAITEHHAEDVKQLATEPQDGSLANVHASDNAQSNPALDWFVRTYHHKDGTRGVSSSMHAPKMAYRYRALDWFAEAYWKDDGSRELDTSLHASSKDMSDYPDAVSSPPAFDSATSVSASLSAGQHLTAALSPCSATTTPANVSSSVNPGPQEPAASISEAATSPGICSTTTALCLASPQAESPLAQERSSSPLPSTALGLRITNEAEPLTPSTITTPTVPLGVNNALDTKQSPSVSPFVLPPARFFLAENAPPVATPQPRAFVLPPARFFLAENGPSKAVSEAITPPMVDVQCTGLAAASDPMLGIEWTSPVDITKCSPQPDVQMDLDDDFPRPMCLDEDDVHMVDAEEPTDLMCVDDADTLMGNYGNGSVGDGDLHDFMCLDEVDMDMGDDFLAI
ncbi:hypothetical protein HWV62_43455 [Athelia sp. TMB]|nr:hypothetical protein HWV62_43455 [Athelia sp. TMB]